MPYVFSTLTCDNRYMVYAETGADIKVPVEGILIKGGAGVMNDRLFTPLGVSTEVTKEQLALLEQNPIFRLHKENGYLVVQDKNADAEKVSSNMNSRDNSAPLTPSSYKGKRSKPEDLTVTTNGNEE
ncbi:hypothetical protein BKK51_12215 [Rodentibacter trehalosifermentans]|uniref:Uncharacterized protein n=1 Tax=Rodentibacter trehalosifermentans TaxID=1908263 RepID=A0A1V3ILY1_9PAST|nr:hypothetical protein [Rodentibacter trehalosifermentans]OOF43040.1 hypothetical protein BKK51_12215 [Rodentibacter trehalosifermentans]